MKNPKLSTPIPKPKKEHFQFILKRTSMTRIFLGLGIAAASFFAFRNLPFKQNFQQKRYSGKPDPIGSEWSETERKSLWGKLLKIYQNKISNKSIRNSIQNIFEVCCSSFFLSPTEKYCFLKVWVLYEIISYSLKIITIFIKKDVSWR